MPAKIQNSVLKYEPLSLLFAKKAVRAIISIDGIERESAEMYGNIGKIPRLYGSRKLQAAICSNYENFYCHTADAGSLGPIDPAD
jgi:hypothetical protein